MDNPEAMAAVERIEGWRALGDNIIETIINKSEKVKGLKNKAKERELSEKEKRELTAEEKEYKSKRKLVQEKLIKFATRIPAFMYLTDFRENTLQDVSGLSRWPIKFLEIGLPSRYVRAHGETDVPSRISGMVSRRRKLRPSADGSPMAGRVRLPEMRQRQCDPTYLPRIHLCVQGLR
jgi:hypothetical protein